MTELDPRPAEAEQAEATARQRGLPILRLYTNVRMTENMPFYRGFGFVETGRQHEDGFDRVCFEKELARTAVRAAGLA